MSFESTLSAINNNTNLVTIIGITVSAAMLLFQSYWQNRSNLTLQKENIREDIKRKFHAEIEEAISKASAASSKMTTTLLDVYWIQYPSIKKSLEDGFPLGFRTKIEDVMNCRKINSNAAIDVILMIEKYEIINPKINIFKTAINVALDGMWEHYEKLQSELITFLPSTASEEKKIFHPLPSLEKMHDFKKTIDLFLEANSHLSNWLGDFRIEVQNLLLGDLFKNKVPYRNPIDKKWMVVTTEKGNVKKLNDYFENETAWGKRKKEAERNAKAVI